MKNKFYLDEYLESKKDPSQKNITSGDYLFI